MKVVAISDTHNEHYRLKIPQCDLLIHAGDFTVGSSLKEIRQFSLWFSSQPAKYKVIIAGNHDRLFADNKKLAKQYIHPSIAYLHNSGVILPNGVRIWGSPIVPRNTHTGFLRVRGEAMREHWEMMPGGIDILVTHAPPHGILDINGSGEHCGCEHLKDKIDVVKPKFHVFGHIHQSHGSEKIGETHYFNASFLHKKELSGHEYQTFNF